MNGSRALQSTLPSMVSVAILVTWCLALLLSDAPYLHDFGEWLYQSQVLKQILIDPGSVPGYQVNPYPVPNSLVVILLALLSLVLPPLWAGKLYLAGVAVLWYLVARRFAARYFESSTQPAGVLFLFGTFAFATFSWYGFASYQAGLLMFAWFLTLEDAQQTTLKNAVFSVALFFTHGIVFLVFGLYLSVRFLMTRDMRIPASLVPSGLLSVSFLLGRAATGYVAPVADASWSGLSETLVYKFGYPAMLGPFKNLLREDGRSLFESLGTIYWLGFAINFMVVGCIGLFCLYIFWVRRTRVTKGDSEPDIRDRALWMTAAVLAVLYFSAPYNFFGLFNPGGRLLLPLLLMLLVVGRASIQYLLRPTAWPVGFFTLLACCSYLYLTLPTGGGIRTEVGVPKFTSLPGDSVLDFNQALYANTRYTYFNYRIFAFAQRFEHLQQRRYSGLGLRVGVISWEKPSGG